MVFTGFFNKRKSKRYPPVNGAIWVAIVTDRHRDRQTNSLTPYMGVCGFFPVKFATSLLALLTGGK